MLVCDKSGYCQFKRNGMCYDVNGICPTQPSNPFSVEYTSWFTHEPSISELQEIRRVASPRKQYVYVDDGCYDEYDEDDLLQNENDDNVLQRVENIAQISALQSNRIQQGSANKRKIAFCSLRNIENSPCDGEHCSMGFCDKKDDCRYKHIMELTDYEYADIIIKIKAMGR